MRRVSLLSVSMFVLGLLTATNSLSVVIEPRVHKGNGAIGLTFASHADRQK